VRKGRYRKYWENKETVGRIGRIRKIERILGG